MFFCNLGCPLGQVAKQVEAHHLKLCGFDKLAYDFHGLASDRGYSYCE